jgi:hypothetical protein
MSRHDKQADEMSAGSRGSVSVEETAMDNVAEWLQAVKGMLFMGEPVKDMTADRMLEAIGFLACENEQLQESVMRLEQDKIQAMRSACST